MRKNLLTHICALCALSFIPTSVMATDYTIETIPAPATPVLSAVLPLVPASGNYTSITQQIFLASELTALGAKAGSINQITFYYGGKSNNTAVPAVTREVEIWFSMVSPTFNEFEINSTSHKFYYVAPGTKVFDGDFITESIDIEETKAIHLDVTNINKVAWNGTSNIVITVFDKTNAKYGSEGAANLRFVLAATETARFIHINQAQAIESAYSEYSGYYSNLAGKLGLTYSGSYPYDDEGQRSSHHWVSKTTFTIEPAVAPSIPEDLAASSIGSTSASLSWSAVDGATSYDLYNSTSIDGVYSKFASSATNSYDWSGLTASTTYYVKVSAVNGVGESALSEPISFTTQFPHTHDGITFEPWSNPSAMPTSGNYYLANDVYLASDWNVTENINLCLNGHEVYTETNSIQVKDGATFAIYDNEGGGRIYGYFVADYPKYGLINIENGGTLVLSEGTIQNLYGSYEEDDDPDDKSLSNAIYNNGTLKLSGALTFTSYHADIYLGSNKYITIESEKPLTNSEPYSVYKSGKSVITSGWANMNGADPKDYFVSANTSLNIKMGETEVEFYPVISLSENNTNTAIGTYSGQTVDVNLTRSLTSSQYNTFCLPFALDDDQLQEFFGTGYDLEEFVSSSLEGDVLNLVFNKVTSLEAGKPYLLQPSVNVANPSFEGVTIAANAAGSSSTTYVDYHSTYAPTELEGGNKNLLFLGAGNELFYPASTANIKAFRAYFELKGAAVNSAPKARIVKKQDSATGIENQMVNGKCGNHKFLKDGQLLILRDNKTYNVIGQMVK